MFKLEDRKKVRAHLAKVNAGEVVDPIASTGADAEGNVIGDDGKPVAGTAAKGFKADVTNQNDDGNAANNPVDYSKLNTHDQLDAALGNRAKPEGWDDREKFKVAEKQTWLTANATPANPNGW